MDARGTTNGEEEKSPEGLAQKRLHGATPGVISGETPGTEAQDGPADHGVRASRRGRGAKGKRNRATRKPVEKIKYVDTRGDPRETTPAYCTFGGAGWIYLLLDRNANAYKLGSTQRFIQRMESHSNSTTNELILVWFVATNFHRQLETDWQECWSAKRIRGEWFQLTESDVAEFKATKVVRYNRMPEWTYVPLWNPLDLQESRRGAKNRKVALFEVGKALKRPLKE